MKRNDEQQRSFEHTTVTQTSVRPQSRQPGEYRSGDRQPAINQAAVELLESWRTGDEQEQRDTWDYLKQVLEEDRLSDRTLLP